MSFKRTIVIAVIFILLGGFYIVYKNKIKPKQEEKKKKKSAVFSINSNKIKSFCLKKGLNRKINFEKKDGKWYVKSPIEAKADKAVLSSFISSIANSSKNETIEEVAINLEKYGLKKPNYELIINNKEILQIGSLTVGRDSFYAKRKNSPQVFLISTNFKHNLNREIKDFRDKKVFDIEPNKLQKVIYNDGKNSFIFKRENGNWATENDKIIRPDSKKIKKFVSQMTMLRVKEFIKSTPQKQKELGIKDSDYWIEIYEKDSKQPIIIRLGKNDKKTQNLYAFIDGNQEIFALSINDKKKLHKKAIDLENHQVMQVDADKVFTLIAQIANKEYKFVKEEKVSKKEKSKNKASIQYQWKMISPIKKDIETSPMEMSILVPIVRMYSPKAFIPKREINEYGFKKPYLYLKGLSKDNKNLFDLKIGSESKDKKYLYARNVNEKPILLVKEKIIKKLKDSILNITNNKSKNVFKLNKK